jgi:hypothetical protein
VLQSPHSHRGLVKFLSKLGNNSSAWDRPRNCASPAIWLLISSILMDCLSELGNGLTMQDVMDNDFSIPSLCQWIDGFMDDMSLFTNINQDFGNSNNIRELTNRLKQDMIAWKDLLETSGGKLELKKCFYYVLSWKFDGRGNPIPTTITEQREIVDHLYPRIIQPSNSHRAKRSHHRA